MGGFIHQVIVGVHHAMSMLSHLTRPQTGCVAHTSVRSRVPSWFMVYGKAPGGVATAGGFAVVCCVRFGADVLEEMENGTAN